MDEQRAGFRSMDEGTQEDWAIIGSHFMPYAAALPDRVLTHQQLLKAVWGPGHAEDTHYVRVHMANLRKKVAGNASMPQHLRTEAGIGYRFVP